MTDFLVYATCAATVIGGTALLSVLVAPVRARRRRRPALPAPTPVATAPTGTRWMLFAGDDAYGGMYDLHSWYPDLPIEQVLDHAGSYVRRRFVIVHPERPATGWTVRDPLVFSTSFVVIVGPDATPEQRTQAMQNAFPGAPPIPEELHGRLDLQYFGGSPHHWAFHGWAHLAELAPDGTVWVRWKARLESNTGRLFFSEVSEQIEPG